MDSLDAHVDRTRSISAPPLRDALMALDIDNEEREIEEAAIHAMGVGFALDMDSLAENLDLQKGMKLLCNTQLDEAEAFYAEQLPRRSLVSTWHGGETAFIRAVFGEDPTHDEKAFELLENSRKIAQAGLSVLKQEDTESNMDMMRSKFRMMVRLADSTVLLSNMHGKNRGYIRATYLLRQGWKQLQEAYTLYSDKRYTSEFDETMKDDVSILLMDRGTMLFFLSLLPSAFRYIAKAVLGGLDGDRDEGMAELKKAHDIGGIRSPAVLLLLLQLNSGFLKDYKTALAYLEEAEVLFTQGAVFFTVGVNVHRALGHHRKVLELTSKIQACGGQLPAIQSIAVYDEAYTYVLMRQWTRAAECFRRFFAEDDAIFLENTQNRGRGKGRGRGKDKEKKPTSLSYKALGCYHGALSCAMLGTREGSDEAVRRAGGVDVYVRPGYANDEYAQRKCKELVQANGVVRGYEASMISGLMAVEAQDYSGALVHFDEAWDEAESAGVAVGVDDFELRIAYGRGICAWKQNNIPTATEIFESIGNESWQLLGASKTKRGIGKEGHYIPWSWIALAEIQLQDAGNDFTSHASFDFDRCMTYINMAKKTNVYDLARQNTWEIQRLEDLANAKRR